MQRECPASAAGSARDRKSTRLNSSHDQISYAVFCLKKKITASGMEEALLMVGTDDLDRLNAYGGVHIDQTRGEKSVSLPNPYQSVVTVVEDERRDG